MLLLLCTMRGRRKAPGLRPHNRGSPLGHQVPFAFTTPLGLVRPMARTHVRLLGPCFKTGRRVHQATRDRDADRESKLTCYTSRLRYPPPAKTGAQGLPPEGNKLHPGPRSAGSGSSRQVQEKCSRRPSRPKRGVLADHAHPGCPAVNLNLLDPLRETLRLPLHSFTYY